MGKVCVTRLFFRHRRLNLKPLPWRSSMMLVIVLCRFSVSFVKQNLKVFSPSTYRKWWIATLEYVAAFSASNFYCSNGGKTLTKAMPLLAACLLRLASCLEAAIVVNFCQEIFLAQREFVVSKTKASRIGYFTVCLPLTTSLVKGLFRSTLEQLLTSSTIAGNFALRTRRSLLPT